MKKLVLFIGLLMAFTVVNAQISTLNLNSGQTYAEYTTDVVLTNAVAQNFRINAAQNWMTSPYIAVAIDSTSGNHTSLNIVLAGRMSDQTTVWTSISDVTWDMDHAGSAADTIIITGASAETFYRQYRVTFTPVGTGTSTITNFEFKQYFGEP